LLAALAAVTACSSPSGETGMGVRIASSWNGTDVDQLEFAVSSEGVQVHPPERRPQPPQAPLASGADVVILLPAELAGRTVRCAVNGYNRGALVRRGEGTINLVAGSVVSMNVMLTGSGNPGVDAGVQPDASLKLDVVEGPKPNGQRCIAARDCASGHCVDGICCDTACTSPCQACIIPGKVGTCAAVPPGTRDARCVMEPVASCGLDGLCAENGTCRKYLQGTPCAPGACAGNTVTGGSICNGNGVCTMTASQSCGAYLCDPATRMCKKSCASSADCLAPATCSPTGMCGTFRALGQSCNAAAECASGACVDGVCCATPSCGVCFTCNLGGAAGTCRPVPPGAPEPHGLCPAQPVAMCGLNGTCNGAGACAMYPDGTSCRQGRTCFAGVCR
jgi:hypothetical protein